MSNIIGMVIKEEFLF